MQAKEEIMKTVQDFIFSSAFEVGMDKAIACAVDRADTAGLPKAYLASYDDLSRSKPIDEQADGAEPGK